jgi:hypothetical protein
MGYAKRDILTDYFNWMVGLISRDYYPVDNNPYSLLLEQLNMVKFFYLIERDENREVDGINLRYQFAYETNKDDTEEIETCLYSEDCTVLEMMVALCLRCQQIIGDEESNNGTGMIFWVMINNLGLKNMTNDAYNPVQVENILYRFMSHQYKENGHGGLFVLTKENSDLRKMEIWFQAMRYLDEILI